MLTDWMDSRMSLLQSARPPLRAAGLGPIRIARIIYAGIWVYCAVCPDRITSKISRDDHFTCNQHGTKYPTRLNNSASSINIHTLEKYIHHTITISITRLVCKSTMRAVILIRAANRCRIMQPLWDTWYEMNAAQLLHYSHYVHPHNPIYTSTHYKICDCLGVRRFCQFI